MVLCRVWPAVLAIAVVAAPSASAAQRTVQIQTPTVSAIERGLANALANAGETRILRVRKLRTNTPGYATAIEWVDLGTGRQRIVWHNASGRVTRDSSRSACRPSASRTCQSPPDPNGACGCDLDPFTNFPTTQKLRIARLAQQMIGGKRTFHLRFTEIGGYWALDTTDIWIDRNTYLPVREKLLAPKTKYNPQRYTVTNSFTWLRRTRTNLGRLGSG